MARGFADETRIFLSTLPASERQRRLALQVVLGFVAVFIAVSPFATTPLGEVWAFIPIYEAALVIINVVTAGLLYGQFSFLGSRALLVLASGYLFTALITIAHALTFPGLFAPGGLLGAGPQSTAWLYMFWHGGFPLFVITYALLKDETSDTLVVRNRSRAVILASAAAIFVLVCGLTVLATVGQVNLPAIMVGPSYGPAITGGVSGVGLLSLLAVVRACRSGPPAA